MGEKMGLGLSIALAIIGIAAVCSMIFSGQETTYSGYMNSNTNTEKVVSEKDGLVKHNIKVEPSNDFKPKKRDFVKLASKDDGKVSYKQEIAEHDGVPHGLIMEIHDTHMN